MKKHTLLLITMAVSMVINAQPPQAMKYKAVARSSRGLPLQNKKIVLQFTILQDEIEVYRENHQIKTNKFGLMEANIGEGEPSLGDFSAIDWGIGEYYLRVELGSEARDQFNFNLQSQERLLSVPFALYAGKAANSDDADADPENELLSDAYISGTDLYLVEGVKTTIVDLSSIKNDADADPTNELQLLSIRQDTIFLSDGGFVKLPIQTSQEGAFYYGDKDRDGFGDTYKAVWVPESLKAPNGYITTTGDCNDEDDRAYPGAFGIEEVYWGGTTIFDSNFGIDFNCDGTIANSIFCENPVLVDLRNESSITFSGEFDGSEKLQCYKLMKLEVPGRYSFIFEPEPGFEPKLIIGDNEKLSEKSYLTSSNINLEAEPGITYSLIVEDKGFNHSTTYPVSYNLTISLIRDSDNDGIMDDLDNCPDYPLTDQTDDDGDGIGNFCDPDWEPNANWLPGETWTDKKDGETYGTVQIGNQVWMTENLKTKVYRNFEIIDHSSACEMGTIYPWQAIEEENICPTGWHVATNDEWDDLIDFLGGEAVAGGKLKSADWSPPNTGYTGETGFNATPVPAYNCDDGLDLGDWSFYDNIYHNGSYWTSSEIDADNAYSKKLTYDSSAILTEQALKYQNLFIRCIKDYVQ